MAYPVSVRSVLETLAATRAVTGEIEIADIELGEQPFSFVGPVHFDVTLTNTGAGIVAAGSAEALVRTPCVRCLCDFDAPVTAEIEGFYVLPGHDEQIPEEQEFEHIASDMRVDLEPAVIQSIVVSLPFAPLHAEDCQGICPVCGADRNLEDCGCGGSDPVSPFGALADLPLAGEEPSERS
jgi:uncharacterized protein